MLKPLSLAIAGVLATAFIQPAHADEAEAAPEGESVRTASPTTLDNVIVTGTRMPRAADRIPGAVSVITKQEISNSLSLTEDATAVLSRMIPGYSESTQALTNSGETLRGRIALRLFDGVPQTSPLRETNRAGSFTDLGIIERIEVINGPSAAEGIGAAGGIINYISKRPVHGTEATLSTRWSTQGYGDSDGWKVGLTVGHGQDEYDVLVSASFVERGMAYDGNGRAIGMRGSGTISDSDAKNLFLKYGMNFGENDMQRIQATISKFNLVGKGNYTGVDGDRANNRTNTAVRGTPLGAKTEFNDFDQIQLQYRHDDLFGGSLLVDAYRADQAMRYPAENGSDKQDPDIAPLGTLIDQSEVNSAKRGLRASYARTDAFGISGLEVRGGVDRVEDVTDQRLALTQRVWVPPMEYTSTAPYMQVSYDLDKLTLSAGVRRERGELSVDDYTTTWFNNRVFVKGGSLDYRATLPNVGMVWRFTDQWSAYASYAEGFSLPNVGIPLRNINKPGYTVAGILDLEAIIVENKEVGANFRGDRVTAGVSVYRSFSEFGVSLSTDPVTGDFVMNRGPVEVDGVELLGSFALSDTLSATAMYSRILGRTWWTTGGPLTKQMGASDIGPDKLGMNVQWRFVPNAEFVLASTTYRGRTLNTGEHTSGRTLLDLTMGYDTGRFGKLSLGVENLLDKQYILFGSESSTSNRDWMAGRGRMYSLSHTVTF
ncbi:TonB-dependent receptor [Pseudoxanthomonas broegbernensis]|uniref:TonB-dependent receptor n=1 Tax=Pseudoxanthomonas broegbernensis TaxID=83619 RepID=A0A7V8K6W3_9GAMM|nr:TonB-dependent receptor [Pseudoxanthomonas broegbernensis]KAF1685849.1 TonB-dependent receptor [Pseudoxanthomonas broegbernensis]MBB6064063.1 iron complex outermembrane receptor protein [Pseudoxanthomonas broegbernensis]